MTDRRRFAGRLAVAAAIAVAYTLGQWGRVEHGMREWTAGLDACRQVLKEEHNRLARKHGLDEIP